MGLPAPYEFFANEDYRPALLGVLLARKHVDPSVTAQALAAAVRVSKAYISQVFRERAHLSQDQLFLCGGFLKLSPDEVEFLQLLLEHSRSGLKERKEKIREEIERIRSEKLQTEHHIKAAPIQTELDPISALYLNPVNLLVHIALSIPRFLEDPRKIASHLDMSHSQVSESLAVLMRVGILAVQKGKYRLVENKFHLPANSPVYLAWRTQMKSYALVGIQRADPRDTYSFNVVFSGNRKTKEEIQRKILELIHECEKLVDKANKEDVYQLSIDLFPWTH